ncbi:hypothetical protein Bbelb_243300 [Branchiostoma belcheri]|nr:hypothetical protein Bbelb_243300 [Branchiostoma belcheri]
MSEIPSGRRCFSESCKELAEVLCNPGGYVAKKNAQVITSFIATKSDQGATNRLFNKQLEGMRREPLPVVEDKWETLADEKEHFQGQSLKTGKKKHTFTSSEKIEHLKVLWNNMTTSFENSSEEEEDTEYVKLKEPDIMMRSVQDVRTKLICKLLDEREKREVKKQKRSLPEYIKDPSGDSETEPQIAWPHLTGVVDPQGASSSNPPVQAASSKSIRANEQEGKRKTNKGGKW